MQLFRFLLALILISYSGCLTIDGDCCTHIRTDSIGPKLYIEKYQTFCGGVFGDRIDHFLTDSSSFSSNIGWNDEHNFLQVSIDGNNVRVLKLESISLEDTLAHKALSKKELFKFKTMRAVTKNVTPLFGVNSLPCNDSYYFSSYTLENGYFFTSDQFKCGNEFINADYLTDSINFHLLIGFYDVGRGPHYSVKINKDTVDFYMTEFKSKLDTVEVKNFNLSDLKKGGFTNACKK